MKIKIVGKTNPIHRIVTGLHSFDHAFANVAGKIGFPMRGIVELAGTTGCGKTTFILSLASMIGKLEKTNISFADIEGYDPEMMETVVTNAGFDGSLFLINETTDEKALDELINQLDNADCSVGIFDSIGAISPISELEGDLGEANMGRRAKLLAQFARKVNHLTKDHPDKTFFMINHQHPVIGGRGLITPGGETIKYISPIRIRMKRIEEFPDGSYALEGKVVKNRYGYEDNLFHVFVAAGYGISHQMTAVFECKKNKLLRGDWRSVKYNEQSFGSYSSILKKALDGETEFFQPFYDALKTIVATTIVDNGNGTGEVIAELEDDTTIDNSEE